jgi:hypothetical protein
MTIRDDGPAAEYRRKAEECLELANRATGEQRALFLQLAQSWGKMALETEARHSKFTDVHMTEEKDPTTDDYWDA